MKCVYSHHILIGCQGKEQGVYEKQLWHRKAQESWALHKQAVPRTRVLVQCIKSLKTEDVNFIILLWMWQKNLNLLLFSQANIINSSIMKLNLVKSIHVKQLGLEGKLNRSPKSLKQRLGLGYSHHPTSCPNICAFIKATRRWKNPCGWCL